MLDAGIQFHRAYIRVQIEVAPVENYLSVSRQLGLGIGFAWLGESLLNLSIYVADARKQELPLVNMFGGDPIHDWNFLLGSLNKLSSDLRYAAGFRFVGFLSTVIFLWAGSWLIWQIFLACQLMLPHDLLRLKVNACS